MPWAIDRIGRSLIDLLGTIQTLEACGVDLYLDQQSIDTTTPADKLMFQVTGAFAEFERSMIRQRVAAGLKRAVEAGITLGRPRISEALGKRIAAHLRYVRNSYSVIRILLHRFFILQRQRSRRSPARREVCRGVSERIDSSRERAKPPVIMSLLSRSLPHPPALFGNDGCPVSRHFGCPSGLLVYLGLLEFSGHELRNFTPWQSVASRFSHMEERVDGTEKGIRFPAGTPEPI
jgi:Resolvase, N terminal domain